MFDSTIGRWQTKDPKSFAAGDTNLYRYVGNHPSYATDPSGLEEWDPKKLSRAFIDKLIVAGAEMRVHLGSADDKHLTVSYRYIDPETGDERIAIFRDRTTTSWMFWSNTHWELMGTAPLRNMSMKQAFDTIHDSPLSAKSHNDAVAFMQAIPLVRTADSISQGKVIESGLNLGNDVIDVVSLGGTAAVRTAGTETIKWTGRSVLAGQWGYGAYEAYAEGDTSRLKGAAISSVLYAMAGVKNGSNGSLSAPVYVLDDAAKAQGKVVGSFKIDLTNPPPQGWKYWTTPYSPKFANPRIVDPATGLKVPTSALGSKTGLHELQHFLDATQHPQLYYFARASNAPGAGLAHFVFETRGYLQSHGLQALFNPSLAMASVRHAGRAHLVYRDLAELAGLGGLGGFVYWFTSNEGGQQ